MCIGRCYLPALCEQLQGNIVFRIDQQRVNGTGCGFEIDGRYLGMSLIPGARAWAAPEDDRLPVARGRKGEKGYG